MIHSHKLLYLAMAAVALGALKRHATAIEDALRIPGMLDSYLPATWFWVFVAVLLAVASFIPVDRQEGDTLSPMPKRIIKEDLPTVARRIAQMTSTYSPNIPSILDYTIFQAIAAGASDIHLDPTREGYVVRFRIEGMMSDIARIPSKLTGLVSNRLKVLSNLVVYQGYLPQDGRLGRGDDNGKNESEIDQESKRDFRIAFMPTLHGERIVIRILGRAGAGYDFSDLGMDETQQKKMIHFISQPQGMIIFTGPTGSGKTTTIYAALRAIQAETNAMRSISTLEDPIEYEIPGINQSQVDEKKRFTFDKGLRAILRQDPDVIMVGEIRDPETAKIAIQAGMTGHLIITTVHTNSSSATFARLVEMGIAPFSINTAVTAVISQRLVRRICSYCSRRRRVTERDLKEMELDEAPESFAIFAGDGCEKCEGIGYRGRYALYEILEVTEPIRALVGTGASPDAIFAEAKKGGMISLEERGIEAVKRGMTTPEEIVRVVVHNRK